MSALASTLRRSGWLRSRVAGGLVGGGVAVLLGLVPAAGAIAATGTVMAWGNGYGGVLGNGLAQGESLTPVVVRGLSGVVAIAAGEDHNLALLSNGTVMAWGANGDGELGDGTSTGPSQCGLSGSCSATPVAVSGLSHVMAIAAGEDTSLALLSNGTVMAWGANGDGELGDGTSTGPSMCGGSPCSTTPVAVSGLSGVVAIAAGGSYNLALLSNGTVRAWGFNGEGQLGDGRADRPTSNLPEPPTGPALCAGHSCSTTPVAVSGLSGVTAIAAGADHNLALLSNGIVMAWGDSGVGQLGEGTSNGSAELCAAPLGACSTTPVAVSGLSDATAIAASDGDSLAVLSSDGIEAWGDNKVGQLGDGTAAGPEMCPDVGSCSTTPVAVSGLNGVAKVVVGGALDVSFSMALLSNGTVMAWGENEFGQLGNGTTSTAPNPTPVPVSGLSGTLTIASGGGYGLALVRKIHPAPSKTAQLRARAIAKCDQLTRAAKRKRCVAGAEKRYPLKAKPKRRGGHRRG